MKFTFIAQSGFIIELPDSTKIGIDLWLDNPVNPLEVYDILKLDYVFDTHDHPDQSPSNSPPLFN